jgi:hypothetical protein
MLRLVAGIVRLASINPKAETLYFNRSIQRFERLKLTLCRSRQLRQVIVIKASRA